MKNKIWLPTSVCKHRCYLCEEQYFRVFFFIFLFYFSLDKEKIVKKRISGFLGSKVTV